MYQVKGKEKACISNKYNQIRIGLIFNMIFDNISLDMLAQHRFEGVSLINKNKKENSYNIHIPWVDLATQLLNSISKDFLVKGESVQFWHPRGGVHPSFNA